MKKTRNTLKKLISEYLTPQPISFKHFYGKEVGACQNKKCSLRSNCFLWTVLPGSVNYFLMKPSDTSIINPVFQNKS